MKDERAKLHGRNSLGEGAAAASMSGKALPRRNCRRKIQLFPRGENECQNVIKMLIKRESDGLEKASGPQRSRWRMHGSRRNPVKRDSAQSWWKSNFTEFDIGKVGSRRSGQVNGKEAPSGKTADNFGEVSTSCSAPEALSYFINSVGRDPDTFARAEGKKFDFFSRFRRRQFKPSKFTVKPFHFPRGLPFSFPAANRNRAHLSLPLHLRKNVIFKSG